MKNCYFVLHGNTYRNLNSDRIIRMIYPYETKECRIMKSVCTQRGFEINEHLMTFNIN